MTINIFVLKGDLNGENRGGVFLILSGIFIKYNVFLKSYISHAKI